MADISPAKDTTSASQDVPSTDSSRKVRRKPSRPVDSEDTPASTAVRAEGENGDPNGQHAPSGEAEQKQQRDVDGPSAGAPHKPAPADPSYPPESDKPAASTSTKASNPKKGSRKHPRTASPRQKKKPSFWSRLFQSLIPCVGPSHTHPVDVEDSSPLREKQRPNDLEKADADEKKDKAQEASSSSGHTAEPSAATTAAPLIIPSQTLLPPTLSTDPAVIVPPSPKSHRLPREETEGVTSGAVQPPGSTGTEEPEPELAHADERESDRSDSSSFTDDEEHERGVMSAGAGSGLHEEDLEDEEDRLILNGGAGIPVGPDGIPRPLLPSVAAHHTGRKCLVLDLDETLVHSSFKLIPQADYVVPVEIEWQWHNVYVIKRPGVDNFLKQMGELYEIVVFTASLSKYADPVLDKLDVHKVVSHRLFRESCYNHKGNYVKDLSQLGRPINETIILDNSPASYIFHPNNAVPVSSWFNDPHDTELTDLCPFLTDLGTVDDVRGVLDGGL